MLSLSSESAPSSLPIVTNWPRIEAFQIALQPYARSITIPQSVWDVFTRVSNGTYDPSRGSLTWPTANRPSGKLSAQVRTYTAGNHTIEMPSKELFTFPRTYDETGRYSITSDSLVITTVLNASYNGYVFDWGLPFLTMNYLVMDVEKERFFMAPAIQGVLPDSEARKIQPLCTGLAAPSPTPPGPPTASPTTAGSTSGNHTGAIVGGVLGGIAGLTILAIASFFLLRKKRTSRQSAKLRAEHANEVQSTKPELSAEETKKFTGYGDPYVAEIGSEARAELPADNTNPYQATTDELQGDTNEREKADIGS
jgi:hypothetical protein